MVDLMTTNSRPLRLGGVSEVAAELGVSRQQVAKLRQGDDFPAPVAALSAGDIWDLDTIRRWGSSGLRRGAGRPTPAGQPRSVGRRFELGAEIGGGGFAVVFGARDLKADDDDRVAVKVLQQTHALDADTVARFERELRLMSTLGHANVMKLLASGKDEELGLWYAMPLARGVLSDEVGSVIKAEEVAAVMREICAGLAYIHSQGVLHRDLKPANVLRTPEGAWAIADFGFARVVEESGLLTSTFDGMGTRFYVAPEQWRDAKHVDERADIYSAGKIMQALLTGGTPVDDDVPAGPLRAVIQRAISQDRSRRHGSATELLAAIEAAVAPAPTGRWETAEEKAGRLRPRLKAGRIVDEAALDEFVRWADELDFSDYEEMGEFSWALSVLASDSVDWWWEQNPAGFTGIFQAFANRLEGSFGFELCDVLAEFARRVIDVTGDPIILREAVRGLAHLGINHNRWHVRDVAVAILQKIRTPEDAVAALEGLRMAGKSAAEWTVGSTVIRTLHPVLRSGLGAFIESDDN
ncbi:serine/threonine-protein kinase [Streptomyces sp. NPDC087437]|uniref:serine/threonine-protein kinase n=1 Tax=Streptomyces sp. NPDC087437 TaxID=3365789 RepID=UPI0038237779